MNAKIDWESDSKRLLAASSATRETDDMPAFIGESEPMRAVRSLIAQVAPVDVPILIVGESGTGKEVVARLIHRQSNRSNGPYVPVNCGAIPEGLFESEMFGVIRGAYTGSDRTRPGLFEQAHKGTLLLDEIGEMPPAMQVKLLRVLETGTVSRLGGSDSTKVDFRLISSTNRDLTSTTTEGKFRLDLYYRIRAVQIELPPLRERPEDIPPLIDYFSNLFVRRNRIDPIQWAPSTLHWLSEQRWDGNVRELRWFIEGFLSLDRNGGTITLERIQPHFSQLIPTSRRLPVLLSRSTSPFDSLDSTPIDVTATSLFRELQELRRELRELKGMVATSMIRQEEARTVSSIAPEREVKVFQTVRERELIAIRDALKSASGNRREAAKKLGVSERTLYRKLRQLGDL